MSQVDLAQQVDVGELETALDTGGLTGWDWARAGIILGVAVVAAIVLWRVLRAVMKRRHTESFVADLVGRLAGYVLVVAGVVYALASLGVRIGPLLGALGIAGIALAFALRDILENLVAGLMLQARRPFRKGDQITTGDHEGRVVEINARSVLVETVSGERVIVPSAVLITQPIVNLTAHARRRTTLDVGLPYDADLDDACAILVRAVAGVDGVLADPLPECLVCEFGESSVTVAVRFWHPPRIADMWRVRDAVARSVKRSLDDAGIGIPFPQVVVHQSDVGAASPARSS